LGTQTIGSVIRPAAYCGIVGFKPSYDRIPTQGLVYFSRTADHVGLFTQDVAGMAIAASVLCQDWRASAVGARLPVLGVPDGPYLLQTDPAALAHFEEHVLMLQVAGYSVERVPILDDIANLNHLHRRMIFAEFAQEHAAWFAEHEAAYRPRTAEALRTGFTVSAAELAAARSNVTQLRQALMAAMDMTNIDLWICPAATGPAPAGLASTGDPNMSLPWTHAGLPVVALPCGKTESGLPLGVQLVARFGADEDLLAWAGSLAPRLADLLDE
jgi:Asp-tRNA(Asn)/Glu-tRNA(Gln) amidotransferase A subunit family amidase